MKKIYSSAIILSLCGLGTAAQNLSTEVVVDRDIIPVQHEASRPLWLMPSLVMPPTSPTPLEIAEYSSPASIAADYVPLQPLGGESVPEKSPYKGYFVAGYFHILDIAVDAGYRFIDTEKTTFGAHAGFLSEKYSADIVPEAKAKFRSANANAALNFSWRPVRASRLDAYARYSFMSDETPYWSSQNLNSGNLRLKWQQNVSNFAYEASLTGSFDKYGSCTPVNEAPVNGISQQQAAFDADGRYSFGPSAAGLCIGADYLHAPGDAEGALGITPYYSYSSKVFSARVGVRLDIAEKFSVMPDIKLRFTPSAPVALWAHITGGTRSNPFSLLRQVSVYQIFTHQFSASRIPVEVNGGLNIGPFKGVYAGLFGGYAIADHWLEMSAESLSPFTARNIKGWHAGLKIGAEWRILTTEASVEFAPSSADRAWLYFRDRAGLVVNASVELQPVSPLSVRLSYQFRDKRKGYTPEGLPLPLGSVSDLSAGASWQFSGALSVFARGENLLCRRYSLLPGLPSRSVSALLGLSLQF